MEQEKERRRKKNEHKQIEPFNRDIDEHEMHLKHKERRKKNNKQKCITFFFQTAQKKTNQETLALRMRGL